MVKKIPLPLNVVFESDKSFPVHHHGFYAWLAWEGNDGVQMVGHQKAEATMPDEFFVIMDDGSQDMSRDIRLAELVLFRWLTFDGNKKPAAFGDPWWDCMWQAFADGKIHTATVIKTTWE
jgi:hypothetical protein